MRYCFSFAGQFYYAGLGGEERKALLPQFPKGTLLNFTLNSNHEAYDGSNGYFNVALKDNLFAIQNNTSYFAFTFKDWLIVALDSVYYDKSFFVMKGGINQAQVDFIQQLKPAANQKILLFTHHTAISTNGIDPNENLYSSIYEAFDKNGPDYWYYGHTHNAIVYNDNSATKNKLIRSSEFSKVRCTGSASIPFGNGYELSTDGHTPVNTVDYFAHTKIPNPDPSQTKRVLNGFALITLSNNLIREDFFEVQADGDGVKLINAYSIPATQ